MMNAATNEIMTAAELAAYLRLNEVTVYRLAHEGKLPGLRVGRQWRFKREVIDDLLRTGLDMEAGGMAQRVASAG